MVGDGDAKATFYDNYHSKETCEVVLKKLKNDFVNGETAMCHFAQYLKGKD
jgi:hypothetical protein